MKIRKNWLKALLFVLLGIALARLFRSAWTDSMDFHVYWKAAHTWLEGTQSPYAYAPQDRGFVFKYPPFFLPFFLPLGFVSFGAAKVLWFLVETLCVGYSYFWLRRNGVVASAALWTLALFWWIWNGHFYSGQFTLVLLAFSLWAVQPGALRPGRIGILGVVLTAKVFSLTTLLGMLRELFRWKTVASGALVLFIAHGVLWAISAWKGHVVSLPELYRGWVDAALSGGAELGPEVVRGQMNHGFTAGILRWTNVDATSSKLDLLTALGLIAFFSVVWARVSKNLTRPERWAGWIAVGLITHPLAWHHSFVLAYPLCALSLNRCLRAGKKRWIALSVLGACCIGIFIPNVIGADLVRPLELVSIKSWGVLISAAALLMAARADSELYLSARRADLF